MRAGIIFIFLKIMEKKAVQCPEYGFLNIVRNSSIANGKKKFLCNECQRKFVENPERGKIADAEWLAADRLLPEKISMQELQEQSQSQKDGFRTMLKKRAEVEKAGFPDVKRRKNIHRG